MKRIIVFIVASVLLLLTGCNSKDSASKVGSSGIKVGAKIDIFTLKDQFDKPQTLKQDTKKIIFVFKKPVDHTVREYLNAQKNDYLIKRKIVFVADVSPMPSLIRDYIALPDLRKRDYSISLMYDENFANLFKYSNRAEEIMILTLDNLVVKEVKFVKTAKELQSEID